MKTTFPRVWARAAPATPAPTMMTSESDLHSPATATVVVTAVTPFSGNDLFSLLRLHRKATANNDAMNPPTMYSSNNIL